MWSHCTRCEVQAFLHKESSGNGDLPTQNGCYFPESAKTTYLQTKKLTWCWAIHSSIVDSVIASLLARISEVDKSKSKFKCLLAQQCGTMWTGCLLQTSTHMSEVSSRRILAALSNSYSMINTPAELGRPSSQARISLGQTLGPLTNKYWNSWINAPCTSAWLYFSRHPWALLSKCQVFHPEIEHHASTAGSVHIKSSQAGIVLSDSFPVQWTQPGFQSPPDRFSPLFGRMCWASAGLHESIRLLSGLNGTLFLLRPRWP